MNRLKKFVYMEISWNGFKGIQFLFEDHEAFVVFPQENTRNGFLAVKTEYWNAFPTTEIELLNNGFTLCFIKNDNRFGLEDDLVRKANFIRYVQMQYDLHAKCVLIGMSCGGMIAINFASRYPELVSCLYLDAPVLDFASWPCGLGSSCSTWETSKEEILGALNLENLAQVLSYRDMPMHHLEELVKNRIPVVMVSGNGDKLVPYHENGYLLECAYRDAGVKLEVHIKTNADHHPHGLENPGPIVEFICGCA